MIANLAVRLSRSNDLARRMPDFRPGDFYAKEHPSRSPRRIANPTGTAIHVRRHGRAGFDRDRHFLAVEI
jgi:hypothetical protein